jgi:phosphopantothenoylcysteine decarboxylase/phosphopantothenate--cysteine ligase
MAEPSQIFEAVTRELERSRALEGRTVVITAGPTREHLDPVRFISNPSTGKMGHTLADRAAKRAADVVLISGPTELDCPAGVTLVRVVSADDMSKAVKENLPGADVLVMAAAVADFKPAAVSPTKIKKTDGIPEIDFVPAEDILKSVSKSRGNCLLVGFAAETDNVILNAKAKLVAKKLDLIVANQVDSPGTGFGTDTDLAAVIASESDDVRLSMISKVELADWILDRISDLLSVS